MTGGRLLRIAGMWPHLDDDARRRSGVSDSTCSCGNRDVVGESDFPDELVAAGQHSACPIPQERLVGRVDDLRGHRSGHDDILIQGHHCRGAASRGLQEGLEKQLLAIGGLGVEARLNFANG